MGSLTLLGEGGFIPGVVAVVDGHDETGGTEVHVEGQGGPAAAVG